MSYIEIETLTKNHLDDAARLVNSRYKVEKKAVPFLPARYEKQGNILPFLNKLMNSISGVAAITNGKLVGFLTGLVVPNFKGNQRGVYCPEWAHAAVGTERKSIYRRMYESISLKWVENGCFTHAITIFAHDLEAIDTWFWNGFGLGPIDGLRALDSIQGTISSDIVIKHINMKNIDLVLPLVEAHQIYMAGEPIFHPILKVRDQRYYQDFVSNPDNCIWVAIDNDEAVAYI